MKKWSPRADAPASTFLAGLLCLCTLILGIESYGLHLGHLALTALTRANDVAQEQGDQLEHQIHALRANRARINALFARLSDAVATSATRSRSAGPIGSPGIGLIESASPLVIRQMTDLNIVLESDRVPVGESSFIYRGGCDRLELHRLLPFLAEQENANPFLFFDRMTLTRPGSVASFSLEPTYLETRFLLRLLCVR